MELCLARLESERPELDIAVLVLDYGIQRYIGGCRQLRCDIGIQHEFAIIEAASNGNRLHRRIAAVQAEIVEIIACPLARRAEIELAVIAAAGRLPENFEAGGFPKVVLPGAVGRIRNPDRGNIAFQAEPCAAPTG